MSKIAQLKSEAGVPAGQNFRLLINFVSSLLIVGLVTLVLLTLSQEFLVDYAEPIDFEPTTKYPGGWPKKNNSVRMTGAVTSILGVLLLATRPPSTGGFTVLNFLLTAGGGLLLAAHVMDIRLIYYTRLLPECDPQNIFWICKYQRFYAIAVLECITGIITVLFAAYVTKNIFTMVYYSDEDEFNPNYTSKQQRITSIFAAIISSLGITIIALHITQGSQSYIPTHARFPIQEQINFNLEIPRDLFKVNSVEGFLFGGWPKLNYGIRISGSVAGLISIVLMAPTAHVNYLLKYNAFLISTALSSSILLLASFALDVRALQAVQNTELNFSMEANGFTSRQLRHRGMVSLEFFCAATIMIWITLLLWAHRSNSRATIYKQVRGQNDWSEVSEHERN